MDKKALITAPSVGGVEATGVSFDGATDYLSRSSDLVGNADGKTFTFSCWVYIVDITAGQRILSFATSGTQVFDIFVISNKIRFFGRNTAPSTILAIDSIEIPSNTFIHVLVSIDMANQAGSAIYINNVPSIFTVTTFTNDVLDFTHTGQQVAASINTGTTQRLHGRLAHLFLDYTYRDLSIEANRRLFITEDLKPADGQAALNPILYLPMTDAATAHINEGTGGDFVQNGVLDDAYRGPNQDNCVASEFDGVDDYLSNVNIPLSASKEFTFSFNFTMNSTSLYRVFNINTNGGVDKIVELFFNQGNDIGIIVRNTAGTIIAHFYPMRDSFVVGKKYSIQCSFNLESQATLKTIINGSLGSSTDITTYTNDPCKTGSDFDCYIGSLYTNDNYLGSLGELYFDTSYIDLSASNPFWDSEASKPKPVRQVLDETGATPLIAMPISADNPGLNLGTGGDFTLNGGGLVGARGGSEFWARSIGGDGAATYLHSSDIGLTSQTKTVSFVYAVNNLIDDTNTVISIQDSGETANNFRVFHTTSGAASNLSFLAADAAGSLIINAAQTDVLTVGEWNLVQISCDLSVGILHVYVNGIDVADSTPGIVNEYFDITNKDHYYLGAEENSGSLRQWFTDDLALFYFTTEYIDFSQEENRNLFVDQLGYPKNLQKQIDAELIPTPLIYMPFDDPDDLGYNAGTGGNFTVNGTVTPGSDVDPNA
jgi:hypothetical protein